ncbi:methyltransferase domain-containing protein [Dasania sp. GY-MA-18]|uniref:Methyltransferase domain-containing protein n=1 Tax=Dasania phycosphaerae TaxID=2950436 RepID=A0A9J6RQI4_9GAMM|nr:MULTISPECIES: methyltransferase domain-containing protein [Dasania]MCR8923957.1 methyltransferase domain-containing protein [Dasania sp. GY-MA-18]MCZ0866391.1 methyltransferase domain-containing protein [Dasania phycosphaerae]MCZ0870115.1 methyltransferase domain-containing protein [Dasania phycosphaerae]
MKILCPQCQQPLQQADKHWQCAQNHHFDRAKQGYTNLLLVQHKRSKIPGDDAQMVSARRRFLNQDFYRPLSQAINTLALKHADSKRKLVIIDAGCGEGYYTQQLAQACIAAEQSADITGIDISKFAVKAAAGRNKNIQWFVANSSHLPVEPNSNDLVLSLFSPLPEQEFKRVLKNDGLLIVASTGQRHLIELREKLYQTVSSEALDPCQKLAAHFTKSHEQNISYTLDLNSSESITDLLSMTPHYWRATVEKKQQLSQLSQLTVTIDINLYGLQLKQP